jgi:hypothetical protein
MFAKSNHEEHRQIKERENVIINKTPEYFIFVDKSFVTYV